MKITALVAGWVAILVAATPVSASLVLSSPDETSGTGLGAVNTVLTMQETPSESGCVAWDGTMDVVGPAACPPGVAGGDETAINATRSIGELGLTSAFNLRVVFNYNENVDDNVTLENLILRIYSPGGAVLFSSEPFSPVTFSEPFSGTGNAGFVFRLDVAQAARANPFFQNPDNRIGLAAAASQSQAGPETFFVADASVIGAASADLAITKTDSPDPVAADGELTYVLTVENLGPNNATGVELVDTLPASVTLQSVDPSQGSCSSSGRLVSCDLGNLGVGASATVTIVVTAPDEDRVITNQASVTSDAADPDPSNNAASEETEVGLGGGESADLSLVKRDDPDPVSVGEPLSYTLIVSNAGPGDATGVTVTDSLPATVRFVSATSEQGDCDPPAGRTLVCNLGTLASGTSTTITIEVVPEQVGSLSNGASVSGEQSDPDLENNSDQEQTRVENSSGPAADLAVTKSDNQDPIPRGGMVTYTVRVENLGPAAADEVTVVDDLPAGTGMISASPSQGSCNPPSGRTLTCELGTIEAGAFATVTLQVSAPSADVTLSNRVRVSARQNDPNTANNSDLEQTEVGSGSGSSVDLSMVKNDSPDPVEVGGTLRYTMRVSNAGPDDATGVTLDDVLPPGVTYRSADPSQGSCPAPAGRNLSCDLGTVPAGASATVVLEVTADETGTLTNSVSVAGDQSDSNPSNNSDVEQTRVGSGSNGTDLEITKTASPDPVTVGDELSYELRVSNAGPEDATSVTVSDLLPAAVDFVAATASEGVCEHDNRIVSCELGELPAGGEVTITIVVIPREAGEITNAADVSGNENDPDPGDNTTVITTTVVDPPPPSPPVQAPASSAIMLVLLTLLLAGLAPVLLARRARQRAARIDR